MAGYEKILDGMDMLAIVGLRDACNERIKGNKTAEKKAVKDSTDAEKENREKEARAAIAAGLVKKGSKVRVMFKGAEKIVDVCATSEKTVSFMDGAEKKNVRLCMVMGIA